MDYKLQIGQRVKNKKGEEGTLVEVGKYIIVDYGTRTAQIQPDAFMKGILTFDVVSLQKQVEADIEAAKAEEARLAEERRIAEELKKKSDKIDDMFGRDYHVEHLRRQPILTYKEVETQFEIKISGFGRGINIKDDEIVLISSIKKESGAFVYHDHWTEDGDYIYSGEGKSGDQTLAKGNKAIVDAVSDGKTIHLFIKLSSSEYYYQGTFFLITYTIEYDKGEDGKMRKEFKFRLRKIED